MNHHRLRDQPSELRRSAIALATLALVGFSLVLLVQVLWLSAELRGEFAEHNTLGERGRSVLLLSLGVGLAMPAFAGLVLLAGRGDVKRLCAVERVATAVAPLGIAFLVPGLFLSKLAQDKPLFYLVVLATFGLALKTLLAPTLAAFAGRAEASHHADESRHERSFKLWRALASALVVAFAAGYAFVLGRYAIAHHHLIQTTTSDLGVAENVFSNLLHRHTFRAPAQFGTESVSYLSLHPEYASPLFVPFYAVRARAETLLWMQAVLAGVAALPLYVFARRKLGITAGVWASVVYLLSAPLHGALLAGFTWFPAVALFTFGLCYAVESGRVWLSAVCLLVLLGVCEAGPFNALGFGATLVASRRNPRLGLVFVFVALPMIVYNAVHSLNGPSAASNPAMAVTLLAILKNPVYVLLDLARAAKIAGMLHVLAPLCLLPILEVTCWPLLICGLLYTSAGSVFWPNAGPSFSAEAAWLPGCLIALVYALERRRLDQRSRAPYVAALVAVSFTALSHSYDFGALLRNDGFGGLAPSTVRMTPWAEARYESLAKVLSHIPPAASVAATSYLVSHVANRPDVYDVSRTYDSPDYLLLSSRETSSVRDTLLNTFASHRYRLVASSFDEFYVFSRGAENGETEQALAHLGLSAQ